QPTSTPTCAPHSKISLARPCRTGKPVVFSAPARVFFAQLIPWIWRGGRAPLEAMNDDMERTVDTMSTRRGYACTLQEPAPSPLPSPPVGERVAGGRVRGWFIASIRVQILEVLPTHEPSLCPRSEERRAGKR